MDEGAVDEEGDGLFYCHGCWKAIDEDEPPTPKVIPAPRVTPAPKATPAPLSVPKTAAVPNTNGAGGDEHPQWLHGVISEDDAKGLIRDDGRGDGTFLVRERQDPSSFGLLVMYNGKPTSHLISEDPASCTWFVNKKPMGEHADVPSLIAYLGSKQRGWPVALTHPVSIPAGGKGPSRNFQMIKKGSDDSKKIDSEKLWLHPQGNVL